MKRHVKKFIALGILIAVILTLRFSGIGDYLTIENLKENKEMLQGAVKDNYVVFAAAFILVYVIITGFSIPGATVLTISSGFFFGAVIGTIFVNIAATLGALSAFFISRFLLGNWVQRRYHDHLTKFNREIERNGINYMLTLRFIPLFPFFLINILAGVTKIPVKTFIWTTSLGIIPGSFVYAFAGQQLNTVSSLGDILSFRIFLAFVLLGLFAMLPVILRKIKRFRTKHKLF